MTLIEHHHTLRTSDFLGYQVCYFRVKDVSIVEYNDLGQRDQSSR